MFRIIAFVALIIVSNVQLAAQSSSPRAGGENSADERISADQIGPRLPDFAFLSRYAEANAKLPVPANRESRAVFMGDSITDLWKLAEFFPDEPYINRGIRGQRTSQMLVRFYPDVVKLKPKVVVILAGINDILIVPRSVPLETTKGNFSALVQLARVNDIKVVIASVLPINDYSKRNDGSPRIRTGRGGPAQILELNRWIKKIAAVNDLVYLDYFSPMVDDRGFLGAELSDDGLHPNQEGYKIMQPLAQQAIKMALKKKQKNASKLVFE